MLQSTPKRTVILCAICAAWTTIILGLDLSGFTPLRQFESYTQDLRTRIGRTTPVDPRLVFIGIDKAAYRDIPLELDEEARQSPTLQALRQNFPWSRQVWADTIDRLASAGAKTIVIDLLFLAPGPGDDALATALEKHRDKVVIGSNFSDSSAGGRSISLIPPDKFLLRTPPGSSPALDPRVGYVNVWPDPDGIVRRAYYQLTDSFLIGQIAGTVPTPTHSTHSPPRQSLAARALQQFGHPGLPPPNQPVRFRYTGPPGVGYPPHPLNHLFSPRVWKHNYQDGAFFKDKLVLIGPSANFFHDDHPSPFDFPQRQMLGPELHLNIIGAALNSEFLAEPNQTQAITAITLTGILTALLCILMPAPVRRIVTITLITITCLLLSQWLHDHASFVNLVVAPLLILNLSGLSAFIYDFARERIERTRVRKTLERYVSKNLVQVLLDNPQPFMNSLGGVRRPVTVLFSDVRNFTRLAETTNEAQLVLQLNEYFTEMVAHVFSLNGTLDKFIGDALMAVWGNLLTEGPAADAEQGVLTALRMRESLKALNQRWEARGWPTLAIGIGINQGPAIVGNLGSTEKMELTVIGDTVNLASRLESLTKEYQTDLLLGENAARLVVNRFFLQTVDLVQVRGKSLQAEIFTVVAEKPTGLTPAPDWLRFYETGVQLYRQNRLAEATSQFETALALNPNAPLCRLYLSRCTPPLVPASTTKSQ